MKAKNLFHWRNGFSALDLLAMIAAVAVIAMLGLGYLAKPRMRSSKINCVNNLKQVGLAFRLWAGDNGDKNPTQVSTNAGGTMELVASGVVFPHFLVMSNELGTPKMVRCPEDEKRSYAANWNALSDANVSYFVVPEADETIPQLWLSGDRNLATNNMPLKPGLFTMPTNRVMSWTAQIHEHRGNLGLADGSVQQPSSAQLQRFANSALRDYYDATTNASFRIAIP
jgi:hypothetical protein